MTAAYDFANSGTGEYYSIEPSNLLTYVEEMVTSGTSTPLLGIPPRSSCLVASLPSVSTTSGLTFTPARPSSSR